MSSIDFQLALPTLYDVPALLAFHQRDKQNIAERHWHNGFAKGFMWQDQPCVVEANFTDQQVTARIFLDQPCSFEQLQRWLIHFLGLDQPIAAFYQTFRLHADLSQIFTHKKSLTVAQTASPFEAIIWAIIGQQVSVHAAVAIRRKLIQALGVMHNYGLQCFPNAQQLTQLSEETARACGLSKGKYQAIASLSAQVASGALQLTDAPDVWQQSNLVQQLQAIKGIGPWTVNYTMMRGFACFTGLLHGDLAVRRNLAKLQGLDSVTPKQAEQWLDNFQPWPALAAAYLWAMESIDGF